KVSRLLALEDAIDVTGRLPELVNEIGAVGEEAAGGGEEAVPVNRRQPIPSRERDDQIAMMQRRAAWRWDQTAIRRAREGLHRLLDLASVAQVDRDHFHPERRCHRLHGGKNADCKALGGSRSISFSAK